MAYKIALIVANAIAKAILGRGLSLAANAGIVRNKYICRTYRLADYRPLGCHGYSRTCIQSDDTCGYSSGFFEAGLFK